MFLSFTDSDVQVSDNIRNFLSRNFIVNFFFERYKIFKIIFVSQENIIADQISEAIYKNVLIK